MYGGKRIENRGERFSRYTGPVLLHASGWWVGHYVDAQWRAACDQGWIPEHASYGWSYNRMKKLGSHIVGVADIVAVRESPSLTSVDRDGAKLEPYENPDGLALVLDNVRALETPVPYLGALGLFKVPWDAKTDTLLDADA